MANKNRAVIAEVLCDANDENFFDARVGDTLQALIDRGGRHLDGASIAHVLVVKTKGGKFYVGEFMFRFDEVTAKEARRVAAEHSGEDDSEQED